MDEAIAKKLAEANIGQGLSASQYAACRENAQSIVRNMMKLHEREFCAWRWLHLAMDKCPPNSEEEAALWELVSRARREFR